MLYQTYRPTELPEIYGNEDMLKQLSSVLDSDDAPNVYLFHGGSGTGKTTLARIVAKELGCHSSDIKEINNATFRGIDGSRQLISESRFKGNRCWIMDEAHQMTKDAQDALLKLFEDTPKNCFYILCTTDPKKIKKTIRNRCVEFETAPLSDDDMENLIDDVCGQEGKEIIDDAMEMIVGMSEGSSRQALVLLQQIIDIPDKEQVKVINNFKGTEAQTIDLCRCLSKFKNTSSPKQALSLASKIASEPESIRRTVLGYFANTLVKTGHTDHAHIIECFKEHYYDCGKAGLYLSIVDVYN